MPPNQSSSPVATAADVRAKLTHALRLDLVGPEPDDAQVNEVLSVPPSRWYLTGFLVPLAAPLRQKRDEDDTQGELGLGEPATAADEDDKDDEPPAARRGHFPSSIGISVPPDANELRVTARWGDYTARDVGSRPDVEWDRQEHQQTVTVRIGARRPLLNQQQNPHPGASSRAAHGSRRALLHSARRR